MATGSSMATGVLLDFVGATLEHYDEVVERLGFLPGGPAAPAVPFQPVAASDDGIRVIDVWESREAFERFTREKVVPAFGELGVAPPPIQSIEVHNYFSGGRWRG